MRVEARGLKLRLGGKPVLKGLDLDLEPGRMVGVIGPNGAGKTTLLRLLAGLAEPDSGSITYDGEPRRRIPARAFARSLAYLAQGASVHWALPVAEIVALGRLPHRGLFGGGVDREAVARAMARAGIAGLAARRADTLSGGERMRVLLARALAVEAPLLLADEPVASLDPFHQLHLMELLRETAHAGRGVAVVLHDLTLAARFCDRLVLLAQGRKLADGPPAFVLAAANLAAAYGIEAIEGERDGEPYLIPWRRLFATHEGSRR